ncbi:cytochrome P450 [Rhizoctonia solani]|nr:cytochrome P450 [Rhizoctonia solani]
MSLVNLVAAIVTHPDVQTKAQQELDDVLGPETLPTAADRERLPYIQNLFRETLRWRPVLPIGVPYVCWQDDVYRKYDIRKGTVVIGNQWAMSRDERFYKDPDVFNPDRYLDASVPVMPAFGWGRRKCPGMHFAESSLFVTIASLLATFTFLRKKDLGGKEIMPNIESEANVVVV